jgi:apolipoprotein N-acyltransferase
MIQANIGDFEKVAAESGMQEAAEKILGDYFKLSNQALTLAQKPDFIIWPETAYASTYHKPMTTADYSRDRRIEDWVKSNHEPLLFGSYDRDEGRDYNTFFALSPQTLVSAGDELQLYHKNILLMFGEYIPFQDDFPFLGRLFPQVANFGRGPGAEILQIPVFSDSSPHSPQLVATSPQARPSRLIPVSPAICYEVLFPEYILDAANRGSRMILNITNDSWFGPYGEPHLHLALSTFRSIETRLPMVRSTNTGFSALVTQDGEISAKSRLFEPEILNVSVPLIDPPMTLLKLWGDWFGKFALVAGALILMACFRRRDSVSGSTGV